MSQIERRSRPQRTIAMLVDLGYEICALHGRYAAARFLYDAGVPLPVICRVLDQRSPRRGMAMRPLVPELPNGDVDYRDLTSW